MGTVEHQGDDIARAYLIVTFDGTVVHKEEAGLGSLLDTVARRVLCMLRQVLVDAQGLLSAIHLYAEVLVEFPALFRTVRLGIQQVVHQLDVTLHHHQL